MHPTVEDVGLTSTAEGTLIVTWQASADCEYVEVALGPSPRSSQHAVVAVSEASSGSMHLAAGDRDCVYVSIRAVGSGASLTAGHRRVPFVGPRNFRDLGGYRTQDGRRTAWGQLFRSDTLSLSDEDLRLFEQLGIHTIWDFRTDTERKVSPNRLPPGQKRAVELPLIRERPDGLLDLEPIADPDEFLRAAYIGILQEAAASVGTLFRGLGRPGRLPAVIHCGGGKDRTGVAAALVLTALGVGREDVLDDYELTARCMDPVRLAQIEKRLEEERRLHPELPVGVVQTSRWAMAEALETVEQRYGGVDKYLCEMAGVSPDALEAFRARLLD
jgi:protein-tyrosine phosphatase